MSRVGKQPLFPRPPSGKKVTLPLAQEPQMNSSATSFYSEQNNLDPDQQAKLKKLAKPFSLTKK
jgi:hypothetical protein